jgi:hypothetical protein
MDTYRIEWIPIKIVEAAAERLGRRDGDGTSIWDWLEPDNYTQSVFRATFRGAARAARQALPFDAFGEERIYRQGEIMQPWGRAEIEDREHWDVQAGGPGPILGEPDHVCEFEE